VTGLRVAHSLDVWLPSTMTWAATQVRAASVDQVIVLAESTGNLDQFPFAPLYSAGRVDATLVRAAKRARLRLYPLSYARAVRRHRPQILHSHFGYRGWADLPLARLNRLAHVVTFYGHDVTMYPRTWPVWRGRYAELFAAADLVLCEGPFMASSIAGLGCPQAKLQVQRLGVDLDRIPCRPRTRAPGEPVRVLIAGAFRAKKGIPAALEAVAAVRERGADLRVTVVGASNGSAGEEAERRRIEDVVRRRRLDDIVTFTGMVPYERLLDAMSRHHVFLSPSRTAADGDSEGGAPVSIIEAAASGMPVVSTTHCDIPQAVDDGRTGLLAPEGDQDALEARLWEMVDEPDRWPAMGAAAGQLARERFDMRRCAAQLVDRYRDLIGEGRAAPA
jgi:colanic acid/amylovoran biosynthesis glycosyltransferase